MFINDIVHAIDYELFIFADDTSLLKPMDSPVESHKVISNDLEMFSDWARQWLVSSISSMACGLKFIL